MATTAATTSYAICAACRADAVVSVNLIEGYVLPLGRCACCGELDAAKAADVLAHVAGAKVCRDCHAVCLPDCPCPCCIAIEEMHAHIEWGE